MHPHSLLFRLTASSAVAALLLSPVLPSAALAQPPPPVGAAQQQAGDPPARVGRLARTSGTVSFHTAEADQWSPASINYPVTSGEGFWTEPNAQAELQVGGSRIQLAGGTDFEVGLLDDNGLQATMGQGEAYLHTRGTGPSESWSVQTPRGLVTLSGDGRYAIVAGDSQTPTTVTVLEGSAQVSGDNVNLQVAAGQAATITGTDSFQGSLGPAQPDSFVTAMLAREAPPPVPAVAPPPAVESMPGGADLAAYGTWAEAREYGPVWYPQVAAGWVPYREGHWAWVPPWGWTWVDDDPWGFAPFHYGRWVEIGGRWAWTPGVVTVAAPPVYAPALVTFFGIAAGIGLGAALASGDIGWCPLGPREAYHPWYHASDRYWREVNVRHVTNITRIDRSVVIDRYANRSAATMVAASVLQASRPVRPAARRVDPRQLAAAHAVIGREPVAPTRATAGVTAATARQTRLAPVPPGAAVRHGAAPGPAIRPAVAPGAVRPRPAGPAAPQLQGPQQRGRPALKRARRRRSCRGRSSRGDRRCRAGRQPRTPRHMPRRRWPARVVIRLPAPCRHNRGRPRLPESSLHMRRHWHIPANGRPVRSPCRMHRPGPRPRRPRRSTRLPRPGRRLPRHRSRPRRMRLRRRARCTGRNRLTTRPRPRRR